MNRFTIEYYYQKYHTGGVNYNTTRTGSVFAKDREEAISKVRLADNNYISIKNMTFEEIMQGGEG